MKRKWLPPPIFYLPIRRLIINATLELIPRGNGRRRETEPTPGISPLIHRSKNLASLSWERCPTCPTRTASSGCSKRCGLGSRNLFLLRLPAPGQDRSSERIQRAGAQFIDTPRDLSPLYRESAICAVPVLEGSGTRGKILEACAYQRVVLTTTRGLEGLDLRPGEEGVIVADDAAEFARALDRWSTETSDRIRLAQAGRAAVLARYDWRSVAEDLLRQWHRC